MRQKERIKRASSCYENSQRMKQRSKEAKSYSGAMNHSRHSERKLVLGRGSGQSMSRHCALCESGWAAEEVILSPRCRHTAESAAHGGQYSVERNGWGTHEFRKYAQARGAQRTSARMGGGIRGLLAHVAAAVGALKRLSTRGDLHCPPSSSHPRGVCLPLTIPWYSGARGRWVPFPYLEQAGLRSYRHLFSEEEVVSLFLFLFLFLQLFLYLFNFHCLCFFLSSSFFQLSTKHTLLSFFDN